MLELNPFMTWLIEQDELIQITLPTATLFSPEALLKLTSVSITLEIIDARANAAHAHQITWPAQWLKGYDLDNTKGDQLVDIDECEEVNSGSGSDDDDGV